MRSELEVNRADERYSDTVRRLCMIHLKNYADTEPVKTCSKAFSAAAR